MPLDAICLRALTNELKGQLLGARIDKVQQPARDQAHTADMSLFLFTWVFSSF